jgi:RNA-binding protein YhbY
MFLTQATIAEIIRFLNSKHLVFVHYPKSDRGKERENKSEITHEITLDTIFAEK